MEGSASNGESTKEASKKRRKPLKIIKAVGDAEIRLTSLSEYEL